MGMAFTLRPYRYEEHGGTRVSARELAVEEHQVIKTLVMEDERGEPLIILMHGDRQVSTKSMARLLGVKAVNPCEPHVAEKHTGYRVGGTSPFGTKKAPPALHGGRHRRSTQDPDQRRQPGLLAEMSPAELIRVLTPVVVKVAI